MNSKLIGCRKMSDILLTFKSMLRDKHVVARENIRLQDWKCRFSSVTLHNRGVRAYMIAPLYCATHSLIISKKSEKAGARLSRCTETFHSNCAKRKLKFLRCSVANIIAQGRVHGTWEAVES